MHAKFRVNLGTNDARRLELDAAKCRRGATVELTNEQAKALRAKYPAIFDEPDEVRAVAPRPAITAPAMHDK
jgi:hypothetical protein